VVGNKENKLTNTKPPFAPRRPPKVGKGVENVVDKLKQQGRPSGDTKLVQKVVHKQKQHGCQEVVEKQQIAQHTKSSKLAHVWFQSNPEFLFGQPMVPELDGPRCVALHAHYMNACAQNRRSPFFAMVRSEHFLLESKTLEFPMGFEDIFDLFTLDALEMSILRCVTL
jgi:hypothetical protein